MVDDDFVLVDEKTPEVVTSVTNSTEAVVADATPPKAPRKKRPSEIAKAAAKAVGLTGKAAKEAAKVAAKVTKDVAKPKIKRVPAKEVSTVDLTAQKAVKARIEKLPPKVLPFRQEKAAKLATEYGNGKKPKVKAAKPVKPAPKAKKPAAKAAVKPTNLDGLTRARSRQREGYVAQGMTRAGDMAQVTLTFPPKQLASMRSFANKGKISMSEAARQLVALGLKA